MTGATIIFYLLALLTLACAVIAVTTRQIFRAAIALLFSLIGIAGIYFWMDYQFIAAVQTVVYAGGIVVLIIFSVFLTQQAGEQQPAPGLRRSLFSLIAVFCGFTLVIVQLFRRTSFPEAATTNGGVTSVPTVNDIGTRMLSVRSGGYALPFELVSILLLAALVGCIVIAMRSKPEAA